MVQQAVDAAYEFGKDSYLESHPDLQQVLQQHARAQALHFQTQK